MWFLLITLLYAQDVSKLATSKEWQSLLHIEDGESLVRSPAFFFSSSRTPQDELVATHAAITTAFQGDSRKDPQCRFPARTDFIFTHFAIDPRLRRSCPYWQEWKDFLALDQVSVIFASSYMSSPSSFFGHTFLKLKSKKSHDQELLDYGLDAAAITGSDKGLTFALKGVFGAYPGRFSLMPYHFKVQDYVNLEGRDLWEFPLDVTDAQKSKLLNHLIELEDVDFPYYYFDQNCSYLILSLLQVLYPEKYLKRSFWFSTIPIDTLKVLEKEELISTYKFRPSIVRSLEAKWSELSYKERQQVLLAESTDSARVLEVKMDLEYLKVTKGENRDAALHNLQSERAKLGRQITFASVESPKQSILEEMGSSFIGITAGENRYGIHLLPALKDAITPSIFTKQSNIALFETEIEKTNSNLYVKLLKILDIESYPTYTSLFKNPSYEVSIYYQDQEDYAASQNVDLAFGLSFDLWSVQWQLLGKLKAIHQADNWDSALGLVNQVLYQFKPIQLRYRLEHLYFNDKKQDYLSTFSMGYQFDVNQIRFVFEKQKYLQDKIGVELVRYF
jgi:hypothetical protein